MNMTILTGVLNAILMAALPALAVAACGALAVWARKVWAELKASQPDVADIVARYARIAVEAAEQAGAAKLIDDRKAYAIHVIYAWLEEVGLQGINVELIEAEIERQVGLAKSEKAILWSEH